MAEMHTKMATCLESDKAMSLPSPDGVYSFIKYHASFLQIPV